MTFIASSLGERKKFCRKMIYVKKGKDVRDFKEFCDWL